MEFSTFPHCGLNVVKITHIQTIVENLFLLGVANIENSFFYMLQNEEIRHFPQLSTKGNQHGCGNAVLKRFFGWKTRIKTMGRFFVNLSDFPFPISFDAEIGVFRCCLPAVAPV